MEPSNRRWPTVPRWAFASAVAAGAAACGPGAPAERSELAARDGDAAAVELHPEALEAIGRLRSPFCPGLMLEVCPSFEAVALRDSIQSAAEAGWGADSLVEWMIARHGEEYRALPPARGTGLLAWAIPPTVLLLGAGVVVLVLRRLRGEPEVPPPALSEVETERLAAALAELERAE